MTAITRFEVEKMSEIEFSMKCLKVLSVIGLLFSLFWLGLWALDFAIILPLFWLLVGVSILILIFATATHIIAYIMRLHDVIKIYKSTLDSAETNSKLFKAQMNTREIKDQAIRDYKVQESAQ